MYIIIIRDHRRKLALACLVVALWVIMFFTSSILMDRSLIFNITINNYLSFSYPFKFELENILVNDNLNDSAIETSLLFKKPMASKFSKFKNKDGNFSFLYPSCYILSQQYFSGSDILYHIDFKNSSHDSHGFVQVWNMPYSLKEFLLKSKETSQQSYKDFAMKALTINNNPGYYWSYSVLGNDKTYYKGSEVFFKKGDRMYRVSYFVPENLWNKKESDIFWSMVKSLKTY